MSSRRTIVTLIALAAATGAAAQPARPQRGMTLLQMEIAVPRTLPPAARSAAAATFAADTRRIRVCGDAVRLAARYKAEKRFTGTVTVRNGIRPATLPPEVQRELRARPPGHATRVYGGPGALRVLVACTTPMTPGAPDRPVRGVV